MKSFLFRLSMLLAACLISVMLFGQDTSSITGTVRDTSGAVVPGASVKLSNRAQGIERTTATDSAGSYLVPGLSAGTYTIQVTSPGFKAYALHGVVLNVAQNIRADVTLQVGQVSTEVTVQGTNVGQVQTQTAQLGGTVTGKEITQLELNGRNFTQLITLVPGVSNQTGQDEGTVGVYGSVAYSVNGGRTEYNNWELDGASILDTGSNGTINVYPSVDAIAETQVLTSNYSAQYGQDASGTVVAVTKSGTNQFHGDVYEFLRNDAFNARSFFDTSTPPYKKNDYGFTLGGPIYIPGHYNTQKDKTFFFWSEEWRKQKDPNGYNVQVPSLQERQGDFSDVCPGSNCPVNPITHLPYAGNQVPISPQAQTLLGYIPAPTVGSGATSFYINTISYPTDWREDLIRVDENITPKVRLMGRYIHDAWNTVTPTTLWSTGSFPTVTTAFGGPGTSEAAHLTASISPTLLNEFVFGYTTDHIILTNQGYFKRPSGFTMGGLFNNGFGGELPGISLGSNPAASFGEDSGFINPANPNYNSNPIYTFRDYLSKIHGNHNLTFGADFIAYQKNEQYGGAPSINGFLNFSNSSGVTTGNALADMYIGAIGEYQQLNDELKYYNRYKTLSPYIQDDWHVTQHLTLNLGLRMELFGTFRSKYPNESSFSLAAYSAASAPQIDVNGNITGQAGALVPGIGNPFDGIVTCGVGGAPPGCMKGHLFNPAPRIGFAWDPFGHGTTAIRGGYGMFWEHTNGNEANSESLEGTPPLALTPGVFNLSGYSSVGNGGSLLFPLSLPSVEPQIFWPYVQQWNLDVQHNIGANTVVSVAYVGSKGTHLTDQRDLNQILPVPASENPFSAGQPISSALCNAGAPFVVNGKTVTGQAATDLGVACGNNPDPSRPITGFSNITFLESQANSSYNALQIYLRRTVGAFNLSVAYTYSHSLDDSSDRYDGSFVNSYNLANNYASSNFDQRHVLEISYLYDFPFFKSPGFAHDVLGNWEISGITSFQTGTPFSVTNGVFGDNAGVANGVGTGSYPDICGNINAAPSVTNTPGVIGPLLYNPSAFCAPTGLTFGDAGRNILRNPSRFNMDMGLFKEIPIKEKARIQFRAESFNAFNNANLYGISGSIGCYGATNNSAGDPGCVSTTNFLHPTSAHLGRIFQFGMKLIF
ncbi:MAG: carboxypeptidase regulatory-like domain-containing protein [Terriglobia bacterium]